MPTRVRAASLHHFLISRLIVLTVPSLLAVAVISVDELVGGSIFREERGRWPEFDYMPPEIEKWDQARLARIAAIEEDRKRMLAEGYDRALCCQCGALRKTKHRYVCDDNPHGQWAPRDGSRAIRSLKCFECREITDHAVLLLPQSPCPWDRFAELTDWTLRWEPLPRGRWGMTYWSTKTVVIAEGLSETQQRCTLAHELEHIDRGPFYAHLTDLEEGIINVVVAARMVSTAELDDLPERVAQLGIPAVADQIGVDCPTVEAALHLRRAALSSMEKIT